MKIDCYIKLFSCVGVVEMVDMTAGQNQPDGWPYDGKSSCASDEVTYLPCNQRLSYPDMSKIGGLEL